jgi:hypothetical protein
VKTIHEVEGQSNDNQKNQHPQADGQTFHDSSLRRFR